MKVSELEGEHLNYWVGQAAGKEVTVDSFGLTYAKKMFCSTEPTCWSPSKFWEQGGPIIEREHIELRFDGDGWTAGFDSEIDSSGYGTALCYWVEFQHKQTGPTALIAAMRAFVTSKYGDTVPENKFPPA